MKKNAPFYSSKIIQSKFDRKSTDLSSKIEWQEDEKWFQISNDLLFAYVILQ